MRKLLLIATVVLSHSSLSAGIFSWADEAGNIVYGDSPPDTVIAKPITPPKITILNNFANRYLDQAAASSNEKTPPSSQDATNKEGSTIPKVLEQPYTAVTIIAPKADQSIRANDGDVSIAVSMAPKLRVGDELVVYLDNQEYARVKSRVANLNNLDRGEHTLSVAIQNEAGRLLIESADTRFYVQRNSILINKK